MLRILASINLGKSRQTNAAILDRIASEFNADFANFAPLKLDVVQIPLGYNALSSGGKRTVINLKTIITSKAEFNAAVLTPVSPIGVFDSGIGGLNVLKRAAAKLPHESFIYFGDNENAPYGNKSESELFELSKNAVNTLLSRGVKAIVVACNTVSSSVFNKLLSVSPVPLIPTLPPIVKNKAKRTLLMCTPNTAKSDYVLKNYDFAQVLPLPFLAAEIERYLYSKDNFGEKHAKSTNPNLLKNVNLDKDLRGAYGIYDIVVLGCTHYTFLKKRNRRALSVRKNYKRRTKNRSRFKAYPY